MELIFLNLASVHLCAQSLSRVWLFVTPWTVCSPPGSSVHWIFQARIPEWLPLPSPRNLQDPGIKPVSPALASNDSLPLSHLIQINAVLHLQCFAVSREWSQLFSHLFSAVVSCEEDLSSHCTGMEAGAWWLNDQAKYPEFFGQNKIKN